MRRTLTAAAKQAEARDPGRGFRAVRRLRDDLERVEEAQVANALSRGWSWARIGRALGVTRQAVHRKYRACRPAPLHPAGPRLATNVSVAVMLARTEASARGDALVGTEHLLAGLLQQGEGCAAEALRTAGVGLRALRDALDVLAPVDVCSLTPSQIGLTTRAATALEGAALIASREPSERVAEEHLLRAILATPTSGANAVLATLGVDRAAVIEALGGTVSAR